MESVRTPLRAVSPLPSSPDDQGWHYTARPEWSSSGESMWMRLSKFSYCNRLSVAELVGLFGATQPDIGVGSVDLRQADHWNTQALATILNTSADDVLSGFCNRTLQPIFGRAAAELRYCPACLKLGFHAAWFQWLHIERCPLHDLPLRTGCMRCKSSIPYVLVITLLKSRWRALAAPRCGHPVSAGLPVVACLWVAVRFGF